MTPPTAVVRRPTPSLGRVAVPPRARPPVARPASGRPPPLRANPRTRARTDVRRHPRGPAPSIAPRQLLVVALVIATLGIGAWWTLLRGETPVVGNFVRYEQQFAEAARAVPGSADVVTDVTSLRQWNKTVQASIAQMDLAYAQITRIQSTSTDDAATRISGAALATAAQVTELIGEYRDQVNNGALTTAASAARAIENLLTELDKDARAWKKL